MRKIKLTINIFFAIIITSIVFSCKKEIQTNRNSFAIHDHLSNTMSYNFDLESISGNINKYSLQRNGTDDRIIIESIEIIDSLPNNESVIPEIKITFIDTEEDLGGTMWLMGGFLEKVVENGKTYYYKDSELGSGVFSIGFYDRDMPRILHINGDCISVEPYNSTIPPCHAVYPKKWQITCRGNCLGAHECIKVNPSGDAWTCSPCQDPSMRCEKTHGGSFNWGWVISAVGIIVGIIS